MYNLQTVISIAYLHESAELLIELSKLEKYEECEGKYCKI